MNKSQASVGMIMKSLRERSRFTQDNIAHYLHIDQSLVSKFESGERALSAGSLERLANLFGIDVSVFSEDTLSMKQLSLALRASEINEADMETISAINRIALNSEYMTMLSKGGHSSG